MLACPDSEWLDPRRNVFELGGRLPPALRKGLEGTLRGAARAWKLAPGDSPGLVLASTRSFSALQPGLAGFLAGLAGGAGFVRPPWWREADCWRRAPVLA